MEVIFVEQDNFQSRYLVFTDDGDCRVDNGANDIMSSIQVEDSYAQYNRSRKYVTAILYAKLEAQRQVPRGLWRIRCGNSDDNQK